MVISYPFRTAADAFFAFSPLTAPAVLSISQVGLRQTLRGTSHRASLSAQGLQDKPSRRSEWSATGASPAPFLPIPISLRFGRA